MTSHEYWQKMIAEYPLLADDDRKITVQVRWLHTQVTFSHAAGCEYMRGWLVEKRASDLFGSMFGGPGKKGRS